MTNAQWFLILIGIAVCICILYYVNAELCKSRWQYAALIFIFSGAAGNLIDRALLGYVVDFINLPRWPAFNFADVFINAGVILYLIYIFTHKNS
jgi:signal peptidase II